MKLFYLVLFISICSALPCSAQRSNTASQLEYDGTEYHKKPSEMLADNKRLAKERKKGDKEYKRLMKRNNKSKKTVESLKKQGKFSGVTPPCGK